MSHPIHIAILLPVLMLVSACGGGAEAKEKPHWGYQGEHGPEHWAEMDPKFSACASGSAQSPIDIVTSDAVAEDLPELVCAYGTAPLAIINNGHAIQVNLPAGDLLQVGPDEYALKQFHFHGPSEHVLDGIHSPMEMHLVHAAADGSLAVVGVMIREGAENAALKAAWGNLPSERGAELEPAGVEVDVAALLPNNLGYYHYSGSLTTPPCSEGVNWFVLRTPIELSKGQIDSFRTIIQANNRPVEPLNGRTVKSSQ